MFLKSANCTLKMNKLVISKLCVQVVVSFFVVVVACFVVLETKPKNLGTLSKYSISELHPQTPTFP